MIANRLTRYFARFYAACIALTLLGLVVLVVTVSLMESADELTRVEQGAITAALLALYGSVQFAYQVMPVACFIGALVAGTQLARRGELLAVQAAGISSARLWTAFIGVTVLSALLGSACGEYAVPHSMRGIERIQREEMRQVDQLTRFYNRRSQWFRDDHLLLYLPVVDSETETFENPIVYQIENGLIARTYDGKTLRYSETDGWYLSDGSIRTVSNAELTSFERLPLRLSVSVRDLIDITGNPQQMGARELTQLIARRSNAGFDVTGHRVEWHNRWAFPLTAVCLVFIALPWTFDPDRRRSMASTLGMGVIVVALQLSLSQVFRLLALGHKIPAPLGAWGNLLACLIAAPASFWLYYFRKR